jgi:hypothetical protein
VAFTGSLRSSRTWMAGYRWLKDTVLKSFRPFTLPTEIQLAPNFIMRLTLCNCKSGIPCSTRDCGYKRYGFGVLDVHVQLHANIICMFWFLASYLFCFFVVFRLESTIDSEIWHSKPFHTEFLQFKLIL